MLEKEKCSTLQFLSWPRSLPLLSAQSELETMTLKWRYSISLSGLFHLILTTTVFKWAKRWVAGKGKIEKIYFYFPPPCLIRYTNDNIYWQGLYANIGSSVTASQPRAYLSSIIVLIILSVILRDECWHCIEWVLITWYLTLCDHCHHSDDGPLNSSWPGRHERMGGWGVSLISTCPLYQSLKCEAESLSQVSGCPSQSADWTRPHWPPPGWPLWMSPGRWSGWWSSAWTPTPRRRCTARCGACPRGCSWSLASLWLSDHSDDMFTRSLLSRHWALSALALSWLGQTPAGPTVLPHVMLP